MEMPPIVEKKKRRINKKPREDKRCSGCDTLTKNLSQHESRCPVLKNIHYHERLLKEQEERQKEYEQWIIKRFT